MARRKGLVRRLGELEVARLAGELFPRPAWTEEQWRANLEQDAAITRQQREFAASHGYNMLELLQAQAQLREQGARMADERSSR